jgi:regulator of PEP synthase PpsR (kinase-PPPase family)
MTSDSHKTLKRSVFFISDRTGLTAESYGKSLLAQFPNQQFEYQRLSFIDTEEKALVANGVINRVALRSSLEPIVFSTLVNNETQEIIEQSSAEVIGLFNTFIAPLENTLGEESAHTLGSSEQIFKSSEYEKRLDAIDYCMAHDDGVRPDHYEQADIIITGVSRSGKTPVSLYLALNFSFKVANYPITDHELERDQLPECLLPHTEKLIGLTISPRQLSTIRMNRRSSNAYASLSVCQRELKATSRMFLSSKIPVFDSTETSIEELAGNIIKVLKLNSKIN